MVNGTPDCMKLAIICFEIPYNKLLTVKNVENFALAQVSIAEAVTLGNLLLRTAKAAEIAHAEMKAACQCETCVSRRTEIKKRMH